MCVRSEDCSLWPGTVKRGMLNDGSRRWVVGVGLYGSVWR